jgi:hypothetical protein
VSTEPDPLEPLLDAAGRAAQPTSPGWEQMPGRLEGRPQKKRLPLRWLAPLGIAAAAAAALVAFWLWPTASVIAGSEPIEVKKVSVDLTVLSAADMDSDTLYMPLLTRLASVIPGAGAAPMPNFAPLTGQALVKDHRLILNLKKGDNIVRFSEVAASIDPTSVRFVSTTDPEGTQVVEQNFEFDLASADGLLKRSLEREIVCVGRDGAETNGFLISYDNENIVLASAATPPRTTQVLARGTLQAVRINEMPTDLLVKPTLVWKLRAQTPGKHDTMVSYLCGFVKWQADYIAIVTPGEGMTPDRLDLTGWVTLDNASGATFDKAGLKLIAGDVNRVRDPWAVLRPPMETPTSGTGVETMPTNGAEPPPKEFVERSLFEYHLYALTAPSTVRDREIKQLRLLKKTGVNAERRYVFTPQMHPSQLLIELTALNEKDNNLGVPLPKGAVRLEERDTDGETALIGRTQIDHTPIKEPLKLIYGTAFDVVGEFKQLGKDNYSIRVRNHKSSAVQVRSVIDLALGQTLTSPHEFVMNGVQRAQFDFTLKPNSEETILFTVTGGPLGLVP